MLNENDVFDNCFIVDEECGIDTRDKPLKQVFEATSSVTNNKLKISTTEPAFQFYTGDGVNTKGFGKRCGFCVEPSRFINAINHKEWSNQVILKKVMFMEVKLNMNFNSQQK